MKNAGLSRLRYGVGSLAIFSGLVIAATTQGCGDSTSASSSSATGSSSSATGTGGTGDGGAGGSSSSTGGGGTGGTLPFGASQVANGPEFSNPYDATPDPKGEMIYFTAVDTNLQGSIFRVKADGSAKPEVVFAGAPLVAPTGISISSDGSTIFVADPGADSGKDIPGAIVRLPADGGTPKPVSGTEGLAPINLDVFQEGGKDFAVFTGSDLEGAAVWKIDLAGGDAQSLLKNDVKLPLDTLSGVTASGDGSLVYVINIDASAQGHIVEIKGGAASVFASGLNVGNPAGIALTADSKEVYVSARDGEKLLSAILRYNISTKESMPFTDIIGAYNEPAGLHRARNTNVFAFVDTTAQGTGTIFVLR